MHINAGKLISFKRTIKRTFYSNSAAGWLYAVVLVSFIKVHYLCQFLRILYIYSRASASPTTGRDAFNVNWLIVRSWWNLNYIYNTRRFCVLNTDLQRVLIHSYNYYWWWECCNAIRRTYLAAEYQRKKIRYHLMRHLFSSWWLLLGYLEFEWLL